MHSSDSVKKKWEKANSTPQGGTRESTHARNHYQFRLQDGVTSQECLVTGSAHGVVLVLFLAMSQTVGGRL